MNKILEKSGTFQNIVLLVCLQILIQIVGMGLCDMARTFMIIINNSRSIPITPPIFFHFSSGVINNLTIPMYSGVLAIFVKYYKLPRIIYKILLIVNLIHFIFVLLQIANIIFWTSTLRIR